MKNPMNPFSHLKTKPFAAYNTSISATKAAVYGCYNEAPKKIYEAFLEKIQEDNPADWQEVVEEKMLSCIGEIYTQLEETGKPHGFMNPMEFVEHNFNSIWGLFQATYRFYQDVSRWLLKVNKPVPPLKVTSRQEVILECCLAWGIPVSEYSFYTALVLNKASVSEWLKNSEPARTTVVEKALEAAGVTIKYI